MYNIYIYMYNVYIYIYVIYIHMHIDNYHVYVQISYRLSDYDVPRIVGYLLILYVYICFLSNIWFIQEYHWWILVAPVWCFVPQELSACYAVSRFFAAFVAMDPLRTAACERNCNQGVNTSRPLKSKSMSPKYVNSF